MSQMADWVCERCGQRLADHEIHNVEDPQHGPEGVFQGDSWPKVYCPDAAADAASSPTAST